MATFTESTQKTTYAPVVDRAAELHNAQIKERYLRLKNAEEAQFAEIQPQTAARAVLAPERPAETVEQTPTVTEFTHTRVSSPLFTVETLDKTIAAAQTEIPVITPAPVQTAQAEAVQEAQYSLTSAAKKVIAAFATTVTVMVATICINTQIIKSNDAKIAMLERQNVEMAMENAELSARIAEARSEETIREFAESRGMIKAD